jgi:PKHD-type hydroxylase
VDGNVTSGHQSALAKRNLQLPEGSIAAQQAGAIVLEALAANPLFIAAALPQTIFPPLFNSYAGGQQFGTHVDNAVRIHAATGQRIRSDLSMTIFLEDPAAYDGGELVVETNFGAQAVRLPAGHAVLYPSSSLHRVEPVTRGRRLASFFWLQSMVRDDAARAILFDLDRSVQELAAANGHADPTVIRLTGVYHNLLRRWADA